MAKLLRVGSVEICMVVSVDEEKGYINLSKKRVVAEDVPQKQDMFAKIKAIHGVMQHVAHTNNIPVEELCSKVSWPLQTKRGCAFDAFKKHVNGEQDVWKDVNWKEPGEDLSGMQEKLKADIELVLQRRLMASVVRLQAKCEVSCSEYEGIDAIKEALLEGQKASKEDYEVHIKLIAHPMFALNCMCKDKEVGIAVLDEAMGLIEKAIVAKGGQYVLKSKPTFIQKEDEANKEDGSVAGSGSDSSSEGEQDDTMGKLEIDEDFLKKTKAAEEDDDE